jgi:hypothetical protein
MLQSYKQNLAKLLTYGGVVPFALCCVAGAMDSHFLNMNFDQAVILYAALIISFIAGIQWGIFLTHDTRLNLFIHSNIATLIAWFSIIFLSHLTVFILVSCFVYLWAVDRVSYKGMDGLKWFCDLRDRASLLVILILLFYGIYEISGK